VPQLVGLARRLVDRGDVIVGGTMPGLIAEYDRAAGGVSGGVKNLIFAANGPKPELVLRDAVNNDVEIARNAEFSAAVAERDRVSRPALRRCTDWR
jgi:hypothetical protein